MIGQSLDPKTHLLPAQVQLPAGAGAMLVAGTAVTAQIHAADFTAWAVPRDAVLNDKQGDYLFQVQNGHAKRVDVKLRSPDGDTRGRAGADRPQAIRSSCWACTNSTTAMRSKASAERPDAGPAAATGTTTQPAKTGAAQ